MTHVDALTAELGALGVEPGDTLMVHASMRRVGGRAEAVVEALDRAVGHQGTLLMVLGSSPTEPFDAWRTPVDPDVGVLAEVFRTTPGTLVSDHPEGRFAARGANAAVFVDDVPWDDYFGPGSPLERLVHARGRVLRLGADDDTVTLLHHAEYLAELPTKRRVVRHPRVVGPTGVEVRRVECLDDSDGIIDWRGTDYFTLIVRAYRAAGRMRTGRVGGADAELCDAADLLTFGVHWMETQLNGPTRPSAAGGEG